MNTRFLLLTILTIVCLAGLSVFIIFARADQDDAYRAWYEILNQIQLETNTTEKALLSSRLGVSQSYDEISIHSQSLYALTKELTRLYSEKGSLLNPATKIEVTPLRELLDSYRNTIFDFQSEISTLRSATNVFYNTTRSIGVSAEAEEIPRLGHLLMRIEESLLLDHNSSTEEKRLYTDGLITEIEQDYADFLANIPNQWLLIQADRNSILLRSDILKEVNAEEAQIRAEILEEIDSLFPALEAASRRARQPELIATGLLVAILCSLVIVFVLRSTKFSRQLKHHADELENIVSLRTKALETAIEDLKTSTMEKEKIAEELRLAHRLEAIGQLAAGIAHEINTPSQFVNDNLQFILEAHTDLAKVLEAYARVTSEMAAASNNESKLEELHDLEEDVDLEFLQYEVPSALKNSLEGMERISKIVKSMKDFSHPGSEGRDLTDINEAIETTLSVTSNEWKYFATIDKNLDHELPKAPVFATELNQVLLNIVVNAAHAIDQKRSDTGMKELGKISIRTTYDEDYVSLHIRDTGCGIPQENIDRVFDPFFTTKEVGKGTGQGLSIARKIVVDTHGGQLHVSSKIGEFTEFHIRLPLTIEPSDSHENGRVVSEQVETETSEI